MMENSTGYGMDAAPASAVQQQHLFFKKNASHTAKAILFSIGLQFLLSVLVFAIAGTILAIQNWAQISDILESGSFALQYRRLQMLIYSSSWWREGYYLMMVPVLVIANTLPPILCARKTGVRLRGLFEGDLGGGSLFIGGLLLTFSASLIGSILYNLLNLLLSPFGWHASASSLSKLPMDSIPGMVGYLLLVCVVAPITEEFLCRGVILKSLSRYGALFAAVISSLIFGLLHGNFQQMPFAFMIGLVYSYVTIRSGSIKMAILLHFINNTFSAVSGILEDVFVDNTAALFVVRSFVLVIMLGGFFGAIAFLIVKRRTIRFSKPQTTESTDNIIRIPHPFARYFARPASIIMLAVLLLLMAASITT